MRSSVKTRRARTPGSDAVSAGHFRTWLPRVCVVLLVVPMVLASCGEDDPELWVSARTIDFRNGLWSAQFVVTNQGGRTMEGQIDSTVVEVSNPSFKLEAGDDQVITVTVKQGVRDNATGDITGQILVSAGDAGHATIRVNVDLGLGPDDSDQANGDDNSPASTTEIAWEAEDYAEQDGAGPETFDPPLNETDGGGVDFRISDASGDAFVGTRDGSGLTGLLKYEFRVPATGDWYLWGRAIGPPGADNSFYWGIDLDDADAVADGPEVNIWDFNEAAEASINFPLGNPPPAAALHAWTWFRLSSRAGPFPGVGSYADPTPMHLSAGKHTFHLIVREDGAYMDAFYATKSKTFDANDRDPL